MASWTSDNNSDILIQLLIQAELLNDAPNTSMARIRNFIICFDKQFMMFHTNN